MAKPGKWMYSGDVNMADYGGKNIRHVGGRKYQVVELMNMDEACGRDNEGQPKYAVELTIIDLAAIPEKQLQSAIRSCGWDTANLSDDACLAEICHSYGLHAPLGGWSGNNYRKLLREAYSAAKELLDEDALEEKLEQPVNALGSTAREYMVGDLDSALTRGCEAGDPSARLLTKMYGVPQQVIDDVRPDDFLPYVFGYMAGKAGQPAETGPDLAPEYHRGYQRGQNVREGKCPPPSWIKETNNE